MDVKEAIAKAKYYIHSILAEEQLSNVGLEEIEFDDRAKQWRVTIGFSRPWDREWVESGFSPLNPSKSRPASHRTYKVVIIDDETGEVKSIKHRELST